MIGLQERGHLEKHGIAAGEIRQVDCLRMGISCAARGEKAEDCRRCLRVTFSQCRNILVKAEAAHSVHKGVAGPLNEAPFCR